MVSLDAFKAELAKQKETTSTAEPTKEKSQSQSPKKAKSPKKKKLAKTKVLYAEDATKIFKKLSEGKRYKKGVDLSRTCKIFSVAWELPEEKGRILPSKVARHFKQV